MTKIPELTWEKLTVLSGILQECSPVLLAFSGGVDSTLLLKLSLDTLGKKNVLAVTGISPSMSPQESEEAKNLALNLGAAFLEIPTHEMENEDYLSNPKNRCFFCKEELFQKLWKLASEKGYKTVLDGTNAGDAMEWRPGFQAARKFNVRSPLLEAGLTKEEIRSLSKHFSLTTWDKPAMPCLSSRIPYGERITIERLNRVHQAESLLRHHGFCEVRVRDHFPIARIEVLPEHLARLTQEPFRLTVLQTFQKLGYLYVTLDLAGFKSGSLNLTTL